VPFGVQSLWPISTYLGDTTDTTKYTPQSGGGNITASSTDQSNPTGFIYSSGLTGNVTIKNGNSGNKATPYAYATVFVTGGDITGQIHIEKGVTARIYFTGNVKVKASDLDNQNSDLGRQPNNPQPQAWFTLNPLAPPNDDPNPSRAGHMQFYGLSPTIPAGGTFPYIEIDSPGNVFATFYAPNHDIAVKGNPDIFSSIVAHSFAGNGGGGGNTGFHYDKYLDALNLGIVTDYQIASYVEDVR
jgi:hypothetical protein